MRQALVVTILLCILAIPATLLIRNAPAPSPGVVVAHKAAVRVAQRRPPPVVRQVTSFDKATDERLTTLATWIAAAVKQMNLGASTPENPMVWVTSAPKAVANATSVLFHSAAWSPQEAPPIVVGSVAPKIAIDAGAARRRAPSAQEDKTAVNWYSLAADPADADARYAIGVNYLTGTGVPQDFAEAARWLLSSAERGNARAALAIGDLYVQGQGVVRNYPAAAMWYEIAVRGLADDGALGEAMDKRGRVNAAMTADERTLAEAAIRDWKPLSGAAVAAPVEAALDGSNH